MILTQMTWHGLKSTFDQQFTNDEKLKQTGCVEFDTLELLYYYFIVPNFSSLVIRRLVLYCMYCYDIYLLLHEPCVTNTHFQSLQIMFIVSYAGKEKKLRSTFFHTYKMSCKQPVGLGVVAWICFVMWGESSSLFSLFPIKASKDGIESTVVSITGRQEALRFSQVAPSAEWGITNVVRCRSQSHNDTLW